MLYNMQPFDDLAKRNFVGSEDVDKNNERKLCRFMNGAVSFTLIEDSFGTMIQFNFLKRIRQDTVFVSAEHIAEAILKRVNKGKVIKMKTFLKSLGMEQSSTRSPRFHEERLAEAAATKLLNNRK
jgi:hypothetical protein